MVPLQRTQALSSASFPQFSIRCSVLKKQFSRSTFCGGEREEEASEEREKYPDCVFVAFLDDDTVLGPPARAYAALQRLQSLTETQCDLKSPTCPSAACSRRRPPTPRWTSSRRTSRARHTTSGASTSGGCGHGLRRRARRRRRVGDGGAAHHLTSASW